MPIFKVGCKSTWPGVAPRRTRVVPPTYTWSLSAAIVNALPRSAQPEASASSKWSRVGALFSAGCINTKARIVSRVTASITRDASCHAASALSVMSASGVSRSICLARRARAAPSGTVCAPPPQTLCTSTTRAEVTASTSLPPNDSRVTRIRTRTFDAHESPIALAAVCSASSHARGSASEYTVTALARPATRSARPGYDDVLINTSACRARRAVSLSLRSFPSAYATTFFARCT